MSEPDPFACLYVIEISRKRIKVGYTVHPKSRLASHRGMAEAHGCKPGREWSSPPGSGTAAREDALIAHCAGLARSQIRREYFVGVRFDAAVRFAAELCGDAATLAVYEAGGHYGRSRAEPALRLVAPRDPDRRRAYEAGERSRLDAILGVGSSLPKICLTIEDTAELYRRSPEEIRARIERGSLTAIRITPRSRQWVVPVKVLDLPDWYMGKAGA